ncbi:MAG: (deoxy)nucleoside triphosphate pyrophosphohydrolase [Lachnospiraceae bacterium]|nr:(deoxy)nucleoside triphosphate pyrophosphohydrolase [Lachnospiraceae bacterium]
MARQGISEGKKVCFTSDGTIRKYVRVVAAVIRDPLHHPGRIFATARGYGEYKGWWEFPGGKIEPGETPQEALVREIREELTATITVGELIQTIEFDYPEFHLSMDCFEAEVVEGHLELKEAADARWLRREELGEVQWLPADAILIDEI